MERKNVFLLIVFFMLLLPTSCIPMNDAVSDFYYNNKFGKQIKKDDRFEELFYFERKSYSERTIASESTYDIGIKFKDGRRVIFNTKNSIYNIRRIIEIENHRVYVLDLYFHGYFSEWSISYREGIDYSFIVTMINKKNLSDRFDNRLDVIIYYYDEIKELVEKIYNEDPVPGLANGLIGNEAPDADGLIGRERNIDINKLGSEWGDDEELKKYTGYYNYNEHRRIPGGHIRKWKVYVKYIDNE